MNQALYIQLVLALETSGHKYILLQMHMRSGNSEVAEGCRPFVQHSCGPLNEELTTQT